MDFKLSDEQQALRDTLARFVSKDYTFEKRKAILKSRDGVSAEAWKQLAEMGLTALGLPEEHGGLPGSAIDTMVVMEVFGRGLVVEPYVATVVLGAGLVAAAGTDAQKAEILPKVADGSLLLALAYDETGVRHDVTRVATTAKKQGNDYAITGTKTVVLHGAQAGKLIVSAKADKGLSLFVVDRAAGVTARDYPTHDGQRAAEVTFKGAKGVLLGKEGQGAALLEHALARGTAALCAEAVGNMAALVEITLAYIKTRKQFGVPIGSFQVLQHRMADMLMAVENSRSMMLLAAAKADIADTAERNRVISAAKAYIGQAGRFVGQQAVQLHGGIGVTDEANVSHYFKRLTLINATFGDADHHLGKFSDQLLAEAQAPERASAAA